MEPEQVADTLAEEIVIGAELRAVPAARRATATFVAARCPQLADDAALVVSELVTNAQLHGELPGSLRLCLRGSRLRVEVEDRGRNLPQPGGLADQAVTGRGLSLVSALAREWGVDPVPDGKVVWAELDGSARRGPRVPAVDLDALASAWPDDEGTEPAITVDLGDVPTALLLQAKAQVDSLVRELTLAAAGAEDDPAGLPAPVAAMVEGVVHRFAEPRLAIKRLALQAAEQGQAVTRLVLTVPCSAAGAGEEYLHALDEADRHARAARLLTLATPPAHRVFRRWYVEALVAQIRARTAGKAAPPVPLFEERLLAELDALSGAQARASRLARLQAVTAALAEATTVDEATRVLLVQGVQALGASGGTVLFVDDGGVAVPTAVAYSDELVSRLGAERPGDNLPATTAARTGRPVWIESREDRNELFPEMAGLEPDTEAICAVPLDVGGRVIGALRFSFDQAHLFDNEERDFVNALAAQARLALQRSDLVASERTARLRAEQLAMQLAGTVERLRMLQRVTADLTAAADVDAVAAVVAGIPTTIGADGIALLLVDADRGGLRLRARAGIDPPAPGAAPLVALAGAVDQALRTRSLVAVAAADARDDDGLPGLRLPEGSEAMVVPLLVGDHRLGVLVLAFRPGRLVGGAADEAFVTTLADACAQALQRAAATADAEETARRLAVLVDASAALSGTRDHVAALTTVVDLLVPGLADAAFVELAQRGGVRPVAVAHRHPDLVDAARQILQTEPASAAGSAAGETSLPASAGILLADLGDPADAGRVPARYRRVVRAIGATSAVVVPLTARSGTIGALVLAVGGSGRRYGRGELALIEDLGRRIALAVETATEFQRQRGRLAAVTRVAEAAQQAILAPPPPRTGNLALAARYVSASAEAQIGGDLYEVVTLPSATRLLVGDVRGKGLGAVRTATVVLGEFRSAAPDAEDLVVLGRHLDSRIAPYLGAEDFVTAVLAEVAHDGAVTVACCGHPPAVLLNGGRLVELGEAGSLPLGLGADPRPAAGAMVPGDRLLLVTDGLLEARSPSGEFIDASEMMARAVSGGSVDEALDALLDALTDAVGDELGDDLALLLAEYRPDDP